MKITSIKQQVKNLERVSIFVDGKYSFSLSLDELVREKLKNDQELESPDVKRLKKISKDGKLKARALAWVLGRPHSTREFKDYLARKKADNELVEQWVNEFTAKKYLNDESFAKWLVELHERRGKSNRAISAELFKKGIAHEIADQVMEEQGNDELDRLKALIAKKKKSSRYANDPLKLAKYLTSQGFNYNIVKQAMSLDSPEESA